MAEPVRLIRGDNAGVMSELHGSGERFTLAYLDPPFFTGRDFETTDGELAYSDKWSSLDTYLEALLARAELAYSLLTDSGSLVIHVDPTVSHYVKVRGDELFGRYNFASEIVWRYRRWPARFNNFQRMHDVLLRWVTGRGEPTWNQLYEPLSAVTLEKWKGRTQHSSIANGKRVTRRVRASGATSIDTSKGAALSDVWEIKLLAQGHDERTGYPTQKPEALLKRLVSALTNEGNAVIDPYCGSGTTLAVCHQLGRRCVGIDQSEVAIKHAKRRLEPLMRQRSLFEVPA